ncbi:MAG: transglutaminase family protein [Planctomycetaceae bacterium]|nr:transglutaminase family protein [Planctomycetaceae bacterium]
MTIRVALHHRTAYLYDRPVNLGPQVIRLRPAPHCRTPIRSYSLKVEPGQHFCNWQQDPHGNFLARYVFQQPTRKFTIDVDLVADLTVINPFDFFIESSAEMFPFTYEGWLAKELKPFLETDFPGPRLQAMLAQIDRTEIKTVDFLVELNRKLHEAIRYVIRLEPGVQTPEETLALASGSCRDSAWLLVQLLRHLGLAARFVSGYLIQLAPDIKSLDGPSGTDHDFTDLHAWCEVYLPGAGWIGLDATSGLFCGEGHLPVACTPDPISAAPITGTVDEADVEFQFSMTVTRIHEDPRVTKPYTEDQWRTIEKLGHDVDRRLVQGDVRLTMGGEPTFVSIDDMEGDEWNTAAMGPTKRQRADVLIRRLRSRFAAGGVLHYGQGKWYPGESLPRWAFTCYWRKDGLPLWQDERLMADETTAYKFTVADAERFTTALAERLEVNPRWVAPVFEDVAHYLLEERRLPIDVRSLTNDLKDKEDRQRLAKVLEQGLGNPVGCVLPLRRQWWQSKPRWVSGPWPVRREQMFLLPGDSPIGFRLPLDSLPLVSTVGPLSQFYEADPLVKRPPLPIPARRTKQPAVAGAPATGSGGLGAQVQHEQPAPKKKDREKDPNTPIDSYLVRTALCAEVRQGRLYLFLPPLETADDFIDLLAAIEDVATDLDMPVALEGYLPPYDPRLQQVKVTPDPGVIEVNIHPAADWDSLVNIVTSVYEDARVSRLGTEKFMLDGRHSGTGGGNHLVLGGATPSDSPFLRRPDLLRSLVGYWNNHPALSYLFSGLFIGPTSQSPRVDEGRRDAIYELQIAFDQVPPRGSCPPWLVDRIFRHLLVDITGNTHRAEFCIDKMYSPDSSTGRLGLVEFRAFEMPPHARMSLTQQLLVRALVCRFWEQPYLEPLVDWGTSLHDRFFLPHFIADDFHTVIEELKRAGFPFEHGWFAPHFEFRCPKIGEFTLDNTHVELRTALEPWYVLGEEPGGGGTTRYVDSSVERIEVKVQGMTSGRHVITCNGRRVPLHPTGTEGEFVAGVRFRAWQPPSCLHPTIGVNSPLVFDLLDTWLERSLGGCTYHVSHPGGRGYTTFPVNAYEAESRRASRFFKIGYTPGRFAVPPVELNRDYPLTLDMRRTVR